MTARKDLRRIESLLRGWLPKEQKIPSLQQTNSHKTSTANIRLGTSILGLGFAGAFLGAADAALGLGLFSGLGGYVSLFIVVACVAAAAFTAVLRHTKKEH
ncbi:MAG: hypothetical protein ACBZ72_13325 [Candidatus Bathyarchaeia archaeon]|jgi:hypothetical protein